MKSRNFLWSIIVFVTMSSLVLTQDSSIDDCIIIDYPNWLPTSALYANDKIIELNFTGTTKILEMDNILKIDYTSNNKYINADFNQDDKILNVYTTEAYKKYYENETKASIDLYINFICKNLYSKILIFRQPIDERNIFTPKFSKDIYEFEIPLPLHPGFDLTIYQEISAIDYDITYNEITFFSNDSNVINVKNAGNYIKQYKASLILTKGLASIDEKLQFTIYAKDNGNPSLISSAQIIISTNKAESLPPQPRFNQIIYNGQLNDDFELKMFNQIELDIGTYSENVTFSKNGIDQKLFNIISENNLINIELSRSVTPDDLLNKTFLQFEIIASNLALNETGRTAVIITFPITLAKLQFEKLIYNGRINFENKLELDEIELLGKIDNPEKLKFILSGNDAKYFKYEAKGNFVKIELNITDINNELNGRNFLSMSIEAQLNNINITSASIIIDIQKETDLVFSKSIYEGKFNDFSNFTMENIILLETSYTEKVTFQIEGNDIKYFNYTQENNIIKINFNATIYPDEWKLKKFLSFLIRAKKINVADQTAGILINLLDQKLEIPEFEKLLYKGKIISNDKMELEKINLKNSIKNIKYILDDNDENDYFKFNEIENEILIDNKIPENILQEKSYFSLTLIAKTEDEIENFTNIILETPSKLNDLPIKFSKLLYKGDLDNNLNLSVETIQFTNNVEISNIYLDGPDMNFFNVSLNETLNVVIFELKTILNEDDIKGRKYFECLIVAKTKSDIESRAAVLINIPQNENGDDIIIPKFNKYIYNGKIITNMKIDLEIITLNFGNNNNIEFEISGGLEKYFGTELNGTNVHIKIINELSNDILQSNSYLSLILIVKLKDQHLKSNFTTIILSTPEKDLSKPLEFTQILYKGLINANLELKIEEIKFKNSIKLKDIYIEGNVNEYFEITADDLLNVSFKLRNNVTEDDIRGRKYFDCVIVAETEQEILSKSVVFIDIEIDSTITTVTPPTTIEPSTTSTPITTTPYPSPTVPKFEKDLYMFTIQPNQTGILGSVNIVETENIEIQYQLEIIDEHVKARLSINKITGELYLTSDINPGVYNFEATAKTNLSTNLARTKIKLIVKSINICGNITQVENSLLIKNLREEEIHYDILQMEQSNCKFEIESMQPNDREYFYINDTTKMLNSIVIDREDPLFSNFLIVQIQLKLVLNLIITESKISPNFYHQHKQITSTKQIQSFNNNNNSIDNNERQYILTNDINFDPTVTILTIIIDDINDNRPEFIIPSKSKIIIGYPDNELTDKILPEYLIKVNAIDKDIGLNAIIRYKILLPNNNHFGIDDKTGIIYPYSNALKNIDETILNVYAIDRDGGPDGLNSSIEIIVKKLKSHHLILLTFESLDRNELNNIIKNISANIGLELMNLNNAIVPSSGKSFEKSYFNMNFLNKIQNFRATEETPTVVLKTWVYSLNEQNLPIDAGVLKEKISKGYQNSDVQVERYEDTRNNLNTIDITGYIVVISLLSVLCIGFIGFLAWIYYFRQLIYKRLSSPSLDKLPQFNSSNRLEPNTVYQNQMENIESPLSSYLKRESIKIAGTTTQETSSDSSSDYHKKLSTDSINENNDDSVISDTESHDNNGNLEKRKSIVTFNELVERIDIESEDDERRDSCNNSSIRL